MELLRFVAVGGSGTVLNLALLMLLLQAGPTGGHGAWHTAAESIATQGAVLWNFALTELWVFRASGRRRSRSSRLFGFWALSNATLLLQLPLADAIARGVGIGYVASTAAALSVLVAARFVVCRSLLYRSAVRDQRGFSVSSPVVLENIKTNVSP